MLNDAVELHLESIPVIALTLLMGIQPVKTAPFSPGDLA